MFSNDNELKAPLVSNDTVSSENYVSRSKAIQMKRQSNAINSEGRDSVASS
jgi:hypothetical protein